MGALGIGLRLIADGLEAVDAVLERRVVQIGDARLDGVVEALEARFGLRRTPVQFGSVLALALGSLLPPVEDRGEDRFQPFGLEQTVFEMAGDKIVQLVHRHRHALASGWPLPGLGRAGVVTVAPALAGAERHRATAVGAKADAGQEGRTADDAGGRDLGVAGAQMGLNGVEGGLVDQRRHGDGDHFADRLQFLRLAPLVELMAADIGRAGQDAVNLADSPTAAIAGEDALLVQVGRDVLDAHRPGCAIPFQGKPIDQPHRVDMQRVDLQLLLHLRAALLGRDDAVADWRQGAVPEALSRVLLQGAQHVFGVFLGLVFVEQRHDLPHHDVHGVVAHLLGDRDQLDAVLRQLTNVEFKFEMVAEKPAE